MNKITRDDINHIMGHLDVPEPLHAIARNDVDINTAYYTFLMHLSGQAKADIMIELGTYKGFGSGALRLGSAAGRVISLDIEDFAENHPERMIPGVEYWHCDSCHPEEELSDIGILFIDTLHDGIMCKNEFEYYIGRMHKNGVVLFDDITLNDQMKEFWANFKPNGIKMELPLHGEPGFGLVLLNQEAQEA